MKFIIGLLIAFNCLSFFAQDSIQTDTTKLKKYQIGISYSSDFNFRFLQADANSTWIKNSADSMEVPKFGYTTGLNLGLRLNKKTVLSTGAVFTDNGEKTKNNIELQTVNYINHYYFLSIPVKLDYTIVSKKVDIYTTIGLSGNFFINHKTVMSVDGKKDPVQFNNHSDLSSFNLGGLAGLGMNAKLADKWFFKLEVIYRQSITAVNNTPVKKWLYSVGPNFGLFYNL